MNRTTHTGAKYDEKTGEILHSAAPRARRVLTDQERAERDRVLADRAEFRRAELTALRALNPAAELESDPPVVWRKPARIGGEPSGVLLSLPRVSGRGMPGSCLIVAARSYDGAGPNGGDAHEYAVAFVTFRDGAGYLRRTPGVTIHRSDLRDVARVLLEYDAALDRGDGDRNGSAR